MPIISSSPTSFLTPFFHMSVVTPLVWCASMYCGQLILFFSCLKLLPSFINFPTFSAKTNCVKAVGVFDVVQVEEGGLQVDFCPPDPKVFLNSAHCLLSVYFLLSFILLLFISMPITDASFSVILDYFCYITCTHVSILLLFLSCYISCLIPVSFLSTYRLSYIQIVLSVYFVYFITVLFLLLFFSNLFHYCFILVSFLLWPVPLLICLFPFLVNNSASLIFYPSCFISVSFLF